MTLDQAIDAAMQLTPEQRAMLLDILQGRQIEARRNEIAQDAQESLAEFRAGVLKVTTAEYVIEKLHLY
jgi:hypothetical protein